MNDVQTNRVIAQTDIAARAARSLYNRGIHVEHIALGGARPVIWITGTEAARAALPHAIYKRETIQGRIYCTWVAAEAGCQIRWTAPQERPHSARAARPALEVVA